MQPEGKPMGFKGWNSSDDPLFPPMGEHLQIKLDSMVEDHMETREGRGRGGGGEGDEDEEELDIGTEDDQVGGRKREEGGLKKPSLSKRGGGARAAGASSTVGGAGGRGAGGAGGRAGNDQQRQLQPSRDSPTGFSADLPSSFLDFGSGEFTADFHFHPQFPMNPFAMNQDAEGLESPPSLSNGLGSPQHQQGLTGGKMGSNYPSPSQGLSGQIGEMTMSHDGGDSSANGGTGGSNGAHICSRRVALSPHQKLRQLPLDDREMVDRSRDQSPVMGREDGGQPGAHLQFQVSLEKLKDAIPTCRGQSLEPHIIFERALAFINQLGSTQAQLLKDIETRNKILGSLNITISDTATALQAGQANTTIKREACTLEVPVPNLEIAQSPFSTPMMTPVATSAPSSPRMFPGNGMSRAASREFGKSMAEDVVFDEDQFFDAEELPSGWEKGQTKEGEVYFVNHELKTTSWLDPLTGDRLFGQMPNSAEQVASSHDQEPRSSFVLANMPLPPGWEAAVTKDGLPYYIDHTNQRTTWADPRLTVRLPKHLKKSNPTMAVIKPKKKDPETVAQKTGTEDTSTGKGSVDLSIKKTPTQDKPKGTAEQKDGSHRKKQKSNGLKSWVVKSPQTYLDDLNSRKPRKRREETTPPTANTTSPTEVMQTPPEHPDFMEAD